MKKKRLKDQDFLDHIKTLPCLACRPGSQIHQTDPDHITTKGAGGDDVPENVWPLCREHHTERHKIGLLTMVRKYGSLRYWLDLAGRRDILERLEETEADEATRRRSMPGVQEEQ